MKQKNLYIIRGPCGSGKTWLRTHLFPDDIPVIDMGDAPQGGPYEDRVKWLKGKLLEYQSGHAILEGIFAPGTPSWKQIQTIAPSYGFAIVSITITSPIEACLRSVEGDKMRTKFVNDYHHKFV